MPNKTDWILLYETLKKYDNVVIETWGEINENNAHDISAKTYKNQNLFDFLLSHDHFMDANTIASCISLSDDANIKLISTRHRQKYYELINILCTNKMILLYESQSLKNDSDMHTDEEFNELYKIVISKRFEDILTNNRTTDNITDIIYEFNFLTHIHIEEFYFFCSVYSNKNNRKTDEFNLSVPEQNRDSNENILKFVELYKKYKEFIPLIYRLINEYYLEYIKFQLRTIDELFEKSPIIVSEYYDDLKKNLLLFPNQFIDYKYCDKYGNNIVIYMAMLPYLSENINQELYNIFFDAVMNIPIDIKNNDGNNIFHICAYNNNKIFLEELLKWIKNHHSSNSLNIIAKNLNSENNLGQTIFDILINKKLSPLLFKIIEYMPAKLYFNLTNVLIDDINILDKIPDNINIIQIILTCINNFMNSLFELKNNITYDINMYNDIKKKISKLLSKCPNENEPTQEYYIEWLLICLKINDIDLFKQFISKFFFNEKNLQTCKYLNKITQKENEPIIITAIKQENINIIKILLAFNPDLSLCDELNRNAVIVALETKNLYIIQIIRNYISNINSQQGMVKIMDNFIELIHKREIYDVYSIKDFLIRIWNSFEYLINNLSHIKNKN